LTDQTFEAFGFAEPLSRALTQCGYATPTPIQVQALPPQIAGRDLLGMAETGSGKTATFLLPILNKIAAEAIEPGYKQVVALILAPTRELAVQIDQEVAKLARNMHIRRAVVLGGVSKGPQINALKRGVHVLVATPGRLLDHVNMRSCDLSGVQTLVIDEADRMFDMGFIRDIKKIVSLIPQKRRTALFSATMPDEIKKFAYDILHDPYRIDLSSKKIVVDRIDQKIMIVKMTEKQSRLHTILNDEAAKRVIVFTRTKRGADRVADRLGMAGISSTAFHGNKAQNARQRALNDFMMGHIRVLVATDIAARGIDVSDITHVINFDMPLDPETYVHRVGRTARKGTNGIAISLCDPSERQEVRAIERMMKQPIEVIDDVGGEVVPSAPRNHHHTDGADQRREPGRGSRRPQAAGSRPERHERSEHAARPAHRDGPARRDHSAGEVRRERPARPDQTERRERSEHAARPAHREGAARRDHHASDVRGERPARAERSARPERPARPDRAERHERSEHGARPAHREGPARRDHHAGDARRDRPARADRPASHERQAAPARPSEDRRNGHRDDRPHNQERRRQHARPEGGDRVERPRSEDRRPRDSQAQPQHNANGERRREHAPSDHHRPKEHRGDAARPWSKDAPKFMKRRDDRRDGARPAR
jgi:ATP-dependent RNA helicase RhlE